MGDKAIVLSQCGTLLSGGTPDTSDTRYWGGGIPWITASSIKSKCISSSKRTLTAEGLRIGSRKVPKGSLIFVVRGMSLKKEFRIGLTTEVVAFGQDCKALVPCSGIDSRYLYYALEDRSAEILTLVDEASHGTGRLQTKLLCALKIRMPKLEEQRRIVEILDTVDDQTRILERAIIKFEAALRGLHQRLFGKVTWNGWLPTTQLGNLLIGRPKNGYSPVESNSWQGGYMLGLGCLTAGGFAPYQLKMAPRPDARLRSALLQDGDLLLSRSNTVQMVGLVGRYRSIGFPCYYPDLMMRLIPGPRIAPGYLELALRSDPARRQLQTAASGTSGSMVKISGSAVLRVVVPRLGLPLQRATVARLEAVANEIAVKRAALGKLRSLRAGLAADLLSGRVRTVGS
ncbi:MAG: restriction endonuclease subunit S [Egibacteraceae bacterium]